MFPGVLFCCVCFVFRNGGFVPSFHIPKVLTLQLLKGFDLAATRWAAESKGTCLQKDQCGDWRGVRQRIPSPEGCFRTPLKFQWGFDLGTGRHQGTSTKTDSLTLMAHQVWVTVSLCSCALHLDLLCSSGLGWVSQLSRALKRQEGCGFLGCPSALHCQVLTWVLLVKQKND